MQSSAEILQNRPQSGFPLSVATGLALETIVTPTQSVIDESRIVPSKPEQGYYTHYMFNLSTLARNIITSVSSVDILKCSGKSILDVLESEVDYITTILKMHDMEPVFYVNSYAFVKQHYKDKLRLATTDQQVKSHDLVEYCLRYFADKPDTLKFSKNLSIDKQASALVLSHIPWDLLSHGSFRRLDLLESHTGTIKTRKDWNSKYFRLPERDMSFLPFAEYLLTTFGDKVMFKPAPIKDRIDLYENMLKKKVHPLMSETTMLMLRS